MQVELEMLIESNNSCFLKSVWILQFPRTHLEKMCSRIETDCLAWRNHYLEISWDREENITFFLGGGCLAPK
jgi:hypothetical protein